MLPEELIISYIHIYEFADGITYYAMDGLAVMSDGTRAEYPKYFRQAEEKLSREQRKLSHCEKGSRNYAKQKRKVAVIAR